MKLSQFVIGIDGGGTKTAAMIADLKGNILAQHIAGPSNFQVMGVEKAARVILSLIKECCNSVGCFPKNIRATTVGLAGAGRPDDKKRMVNGLRRLTSSKKVPLRNVRIESDALIALEGAFSGGAGIILIAGSGSIAFGKDEKGTIHRAGGWGRILGDEGSGFFIGKHALTVVCRYLDGRSAPTLLTAMVAKKFGLKTSTDIISAVYKDNLNIAAIAPLVFEAGEQGDAAASEIIQLASIELAEHVRALVTKIQDGKEETVRRKIPLSFIGGLIAEETPLTRALRRQISNSFPNIDIVVPMAPPVYGAVLMALA
jgi:N-acetylglucosamine kinase-like BadF-type ATPase